MSYSPSELFRRVWQEALRVVLQQHHWVGHLSESIISQRNSEGLDHCNGLMKCPCLMTHALLLPDAPTKKRKRKRRKKRNQFLNANKVSIIHSVRYHFRFHSFYLTC
jgi:hypothetical protein